MYILLITAFVMGASGQPEARMAHAITPNKETCEAARDMAIAQMEASRPILFYAVSCDVTDMVEG